MFKNKSNSSPTSSNILSNISVNFFWQVVKEDMLLKDISIFNSVSHFVQQSRTIWAILVEGITSNVSVKLY